MRIEESKGVLLSLLANSGVTPGRVAGEKVRNIVEVFQRFVLIPADDAASVDQDGDGTLAQTGAFSFRGPREFEADLTRQFIETDDRDPEMWQLRCTLRWNTSEETDRLPGGHVWSFGKPWDVFFDEALRLPGWAWALTSTAPATLDVDLTMV